MAVNVLFWLLVCLFGRFAEANTSLSWFDFYDEKTLIGHNDEVIGGINEEECARRCLVGTSTVPSGSCLSFDYDNQYSKCILSRSNKDTPGAVFSYSNPPSRFDYYHRTEANTSLSWFDFYDGKVLIGHNDEVIDGINEEECARRCLVGTSAVPFGSCLSFDYNHHFSLCLLSRSNKDTPGAALADSNPPSRLDYYHKKVVQCVTLTAPENGAVTGGNSYQDVVQFTCNHGYQLIGGSSRTCQADGTWTGADPTCIGSSDITPTFIWTAAISTEIQLTWSLPGYADLVTGYTISVRPIGSTDVTSIGVGRLSSLFWPVRNLIPYTNYEFWVVAQIGDFQSDRSEIIIQRTLEGVPTVPRKVRMTNLSWSELRVTWNDPDNFYGPRRSYVIDLYTSTNSDAVQNGTEVAQNSTEYRFSGLEPATSYTVEVRANNGRNTGPPGNATARTSDGYQASPTNINRREEDTHCDISWSSPSATRGDIIGYKVHLQGAYFGKNGQTQRGEYSVKSTTSTSIRLMKSTKTEILDLLPNTVYTINVTGFTYTGEGDYSQTVNCTVPPGKPSKPESPVPPSDPKDVSTTFPLQVKTSSDRNGPIGCYHIVVVKSSIPVILPYPEMLQPYKTVEEAKGSGDGNIAYIAMALTPDTVGDSTTVTVGDGTLTSCKPQQGGRKRRALTSDDVYNQEYTNSPLEPDSSYTASVRAYGPNDGTQPYFSASQYMDPVSTAANRDGSVIPSHTFQAGMIGLGVVSALLLITLVVSVAVNVVLKRRLANSKSKHEANGTTVQNDAFDDTYYTDTRTNRAADDGTYCDVINDDNTKRRGTNQDGEYDMPDAGGEEGAYQTLDPRTLDKGNNAYQKLAKNRVLKHTY